MRGTALPADVNQELLGLGFLDGNVLDEQPQHPLAVLGLGGGSMPYTRQIPGESQHFRLLLGGGHASFLPQNFRGLLLEVLQLKQRIVPATLQCAGHQTLRRIDFLIAPLGECGFVLGTFEPHLPLAQDRLIACFQLLQSCQCELQFGGLQGLQHFLHDGGIQQITTEAHAVLGGQSFAT